MGALHHQLELAALLAAHHELFRLCGCHPVLLLSSSSSVGHEEEDRGNEQARGGETGSASKISGVRTAAVGTARGKEEPQHRISGSGKGVRDSSQSSPHTRTSVLIHVVGSPHARHGRTRSDRTGHQKASRHVAPLPHPNTHTHNHAQLAAYPPSTRGPTMPTPTTSSTKLPHSRAQNPPEPESR